MTHHADYEVGVLETTGRTMSLHRRAPTQLPVGSAVAYAVERLPGRFEALLLLPPGSTASVAGLEPSVAAIRVKNGDHITIVPETGEVDGASAIVFRTITLRVSAAAVAARRCAGCRRAFAPHDDVLVCAECGAVHCAELCGKAQACDVCGTPFHPGAER